MLLVFEKRADSNSRAAIEDIRVFVGGEKRMAQLHSIAWSAHSAAREINDRAATANAYTYPLTNVHQTKRILGPATHVAMALELDIDGDLNIGDGEVRWAIKYVNNELDAQV